MGLIGTQTVAYLRGRPDAAAVLYGAIVPHLPWVRRSLPPAQVRAWERLIAGVRTALGDDEFDLAARSGSSMSWDDAVNEAIAICAAEVDEPGESRPASRTSPPRAPEVPLTDRELEVLRQIAAGDSNKDVAAALGITPKTVMHHSVAIYRKLGVRGRAEATAYAYRHGLVEAPQRL
jgi:DNA-binding NarL/FixJ family response regulator